MCAYVYIHIFFTIKIFKENTLQNLHEFALKNEEGRIILTFI